MIGLVNQIPSWRQPSFAFIFLALLIIVAQVYLLARNREKKENLDIFMSSFLNTILLAVIIILLWSSWY